MDATGTLGPAWERTRNALFRPFDFGKWISFGVIFFLQSLLEGSGLSFPNTSRSSGRGGAAGPSWRDMVAEAKSWVDANMSTILLLVAVGVLVGIGLGILFLWLGTRGQMMSIRAVATGRATIGEHWAATRESGWKLFKVQLLISAIGFLLWAPLVWLGVVRFVDLVITGAPDDALIAAAIPFVVVGAVLAFVMAVVQTLIRNFVAPVMERCHMGAGAAWSHFSGAASGHWGSIFLFFVIRFFLGLGAAIVAFVVVFCTCCIGAVPVLHQTALAPWYFFERAYGLYAIESLGPGMKMFEDVPQPAYPAYPPPYPPPYPPGV